MTSCDFQGQLLGTAESMFGVEKLLLQRAIVGEKKKAFAIFVQSSSRIYAFGKVEFCERALIWLSRELAENTIRLVKRDVFFGHIM